MDKPITREVLAALRELERGAEFGPWIVNVDKGKVGNNWMVFYFGYDDEARGIVEVTTDHLHVSECRSNGALAEATFVAAMRNDAVALLDAAEWALNNGYGDQQMLPAVAKKEGR